MEDKLAREWIRHVEFKLTSVINNWNRDLIEGTKIKECPVCKHPVLVIKHPYRTVSTTNVCTGSGFTLVEDPCYQCLTCGVRFTCNKKEVCEILGEGKGGIKDG